MSQSDPEVPRAEDSTSALEDDAPTPDGLSQPKWRRDFPIDWSTDDYVSRRDLVRFMVLTSAAFATGQAWIYLRSVTESRDSNPETAAIADVEELEIGEAKTFEYPPGSTPRLLVRTGQDTFVAYDQQCTHLLCPVVPRVAEGKLHCPCHNGWFDLATGRPTAGPPRRPLPRVLVEIRGTKVYATDVEAEPR